MKENSLDKDLVFPRSIRGRSDIPQTANFKILSLDGGGIKGLYAAKLLAQIEVKTGRPIGDYFDMICGTSTGGLLALGITNGIPCTEMARFYKEHGPLIFPYESWARRQIRRLVQYRFGTKYGNAQLRQALKELIGDYKTLKDANHLLCIPAFNLTKGRPSVFKKPFGMYHRDGRFSMMDVALATSAAPTFLPAVSIEGDQFVDGGIFSNNPSLIGYTEAVDHFFGKTFDMGDDLIKYEGISLLSIGLPGKVIGECPNISTKRSFLKWREKLVSTAMTGVDYITQYQVDKLINSMEGSLYYRLTPPQLSVSQLKHIDMDNSSSKAIQTLMTYGQDVGDDFTGANWHQIHDFFSNSRTYKFLNNG